MRSAQEAADRAAEAIDKYEPGHGSLSAGVAASPLEGSAFGFAEYEHHVTEDLGLFARVRGGAVNRQPSLDAMAGLEWRF